MSVKDVDCPFQAVSHSSSSFPAFMYILKSFLFEHKLLLPPPHLTVKWKIFSEANILRQKFNLNFNEHRLDIPVRLLAAKNQHSEIYLLTVPDNFSRIR